MEEPMSRYNLLFVYCYFVFLLQFSQRTCNTILFSACIMGSEQKELGDRRITSWWTQAAFGGRQNGFVYPQRRHSVRSHMSNVVVSIVQVITVRPRA